MCRVDRICCRQDSAQVVVTKSIHGGQGCRYDPKGSFITFLAMCRNDSWGWLRDNLQSQLVEKLPCILSSYKLDLFCTVQRSVTEKAYKLKIV